MARPNKSGKIGQVNNGSKSNNYETNVKTEDLAFAQTAFLVPKKEVAPTDEEVKEAIVLPGGATTIDFMMPEDEREILEKNLNQYGDVEELNKLLKIAKKNKILREDLKTMEILEGLGNLGNGVINVLSDERNLQVLDDYLQNLLESGGDVAKAYKEAALGAKAMLDAREQMLNKMKVGKSGKTAKIALKFTNDSGEDFQLGAEVDV